MQIQSGGPKGLRLLPVLGYARRTSAANVQESVWMVSGESMSNPIGRQAVVVGAGMGGLSAARALADYFEQVVVIENDALPADAAPRAACRRSKGFSRVPSELCTRLAPWSFG
jgi:hypothetical protein